MKKISGILILSLLLLVSIATIPPTVFAQTPTASTNPLLHVGWNHTQETEEYIWDSASQQWVFGETMKLVITNDSGINIEEGDYWASRGSPLTFTLIIPQHFFEGATELESAVVGATFEGIGTKAELYMFYHAPSNTWHAFSGIYDNTASSPSDPSAFFNIYPLGCDVSVGSQAINVSFVGSFNTSAPTGVYHTWAHAMDNASNYLTPSWFSYGSTGRIPMPPIALECELRDIWWMWQKPPKYDIRILNETEDVIRYADANETVIFEMAMDQEIGFAAFEIGEVASWEQQQYWRNITWNWPDDMYNPATTWSSYEMPQAPQLGFKYNASLDEAEEAQAVIFYSNVTWIWEAWDSSYGMWVGYETIVRDDINITHFVDFDQTESGDIAPNVVRWYVNFTTNVMNRSNYLGVDNTGSMTTASVPSDTITTDYTYGKTIHIEPWQPRYYGTQSIDGVPAEPSFRFISSGGARLALHDIILEGEIRDLTGEFVDNVGYNEWFNVSIDIYAPLESIEKKGELIPHPTIHGAFIREDYNTTAAAFILEGYTSGWNDTHSWLTGVYIELLIHLDTLSIIGQKWVMETTTWEIYSGAIVEHTRLNNTSPDFVNATNIIYNLGDDQSYFGLDMEFLPNAPEAEYRCHLVPIQTRTILTNQSGSWEINHTRYVALDLSAATHWTPTTFNLGNVYTWVPEIWTVSDSGALDLDGDLETLDDQYYVKQVSNWHDEIQRTIDSLVVHMVFDPTPAPEDEGDEFVSVNWMGLVTETMTYTWNVDFFWFHADDMSPVNATEMADIQELVWQDINELVPAPGYNAIACMARNYSWEDLQDNYWWLEDNTWECSWFGFGQVQTFELATSTNSTSWARFHSQYAGLLLFVDNTTIDGGNGVPDFTVQDGFVDSDEVTHYFLIENVGSIEFTMPFNSTESTGSRTLIVDRDFDETIDFGARIYDVNGTLYPVHAAVGSGIRSCYDYYGSPDGLVGLNASAFDHILSSATIDEMAFDVHYTVHLANSTANPDPNNNLVSVKVDQYVGDWTLHHFNNTVLEGRSLAIAYFGDLSTTTYTEFSVDDTPVGTNNDDTEIGDVYMFGAEGRTFAEIQMGGQEYIWGYDDGTYNCSAATVPLGAFSAMYQASDGTTIASWEISGTFFFMLSSFVNWGGHSIDNDPSFGIYTTALDMVVGGGGPNPTWLLVIIAVVGVIVAIIAAVIVVNIRRRGRSKGKPAEEPVRDYWIDSEPKATD